MKRRVTVIEPQNDGREENTLEGSLARQESRGSPAASLLSALGDQVQQGDTILLLDRGRLVASSESVREEGDDPEGQLARLERQGLLRRASDPLPREILMAPPPKPAESASALAALLDERRTGR
jgi:hypothetical protein